MNKKLLLWITVLTLLFTSCKKDNPEEEIISPGLTETSIGFLGHKGSGNNNYNDVFLENTLPSVKNALQYLDGVEVDVQMSTDGTLWIWHDADLANDCDTSDTRSLINLPDSVIEKLVICHKTKSDRIYRVKELVDYWNSTSKGFYISFEIKAAFSSAVFNAAGGKASYMTRAGQAFANLFQTFNHNGQIMVEVDYVAFCQEVRKTVSGIKFCLLSEDDIQPKIDRALSQGYEGISCNYNDISVTAAGIALAQENGLFVQLWTPYYKDELISAFDRKPDFIQTDNVEAKQDLLVY